MKKEVLLHLTLGMLLFGAPLFGMDSSTEEETQSDSELTIGSLLASQVAGSRELLSYGKQAAQDLFHLSHPSEAQTESDAAKQLHSKEQLLSQFLSEMAEYNESVRCLSPELISRYEMASCPVPAGTATFDRNSMQTTY